MAEKPKLPFTIEPHTTSDKSFAIMGPDDFNLIIDYDDVDHKTTDQMASKVARILNTFWQDDED
jgi:hypothetical protein